MSITIIMLKSSLLNNLDVIKMDRFSLFASKWKYYIFVFIFCLRKYRTLVCSSTISTYIFVNMILNITATPLIYKENISVMTSFLRCGNNISPFLMKKQTKVNMYPIMITRSLSHASKSHQKWSALIFEDKNTDDRFFSLFKATKIVTFLTHQLPAMLDLKSLPKVYLDSMIPWATWKKIFKITWWTHHHRVQEFVRGTPIESI